LKLNTLVHVTHFRDLPKNNPLNDPSKINFTGVYGSSTDSHQNKKWHRSSMFHDDYKITR